MVNHLVKALYEVTSVYDSGQILIGDRQRSQGVLDLSRAGCLDGVAGLDRDRARGIEPEAVLDRRGGSIIIDVADSLAVCGSTRTGDREHFFRIEDIALIGIIRIRQLEDCGIIGLSTVDGTDLAVSGGIQRRIDGEGLADSEFLCLGVTVKRGDGDDRLIGRSLGGRFGRRVSRSLGGSRSRSRSGRFGRSVGRRVGGRFGGSLGRLFSGSIVRGMVNHLVIALDESTSVYDFGQLLISDRQRSQGVLDLSRAGCLDGVAGLDRDRARGIEPEAVLDRRGGSIIIDVADSLAVCGSTRTGNREHLFRIEDIALIGIIRIRQFKDSGIIGLGAVDGTDLAVCGSIQRRIDGEGFADSIFLRLGMTIERSNGDGSFFNGRCACCDDGAGKSRQNQYRSKQQTN